MIVTLKPEMLLEPHPETGVVRLYRDRSAWPDDPVFELHPAQGLILAMLDGRRSIEQAAEVVSETTGSRYASVLGATGAVTQRFRQLMVEVTDTTRDNGLHRPVLAPDAFDFASSVDLRARREAAPVSLQWVVTESCNRRCRYCFRDAGTQPYPSGGEPGLTQERLEEIAVEAARIGVISLILTGGEPVLRPDLFEVISQFTERQIEVLLTTKAGIKSDAMARLAANRWAVLHLSLDAADPAMVDHLTGTPGAFDEIIGTLEQAAKHDVKVVLRPLMTALNVSGFTALVDLVAGLGVREILVELYGESCGRHEDRFLLGPDDRTRLDQLVLDARGRYPDMTISYRTPAAETSTAPGTSTRGCVEGMRGLTFMPDGTVTRCEHWTSSDALVYGDLKTESIMQAWRSEALQQICFAPPDAFKGTACHTCGEHQHCATRRGRCLVTTLEAYGTIYAPDIHCPIGAFQPPARRHHRRC